MAKTIARFEPTPERSPEACERHYVDVHVPFAQDVLRGMAGVRSYHVGRVVAEADLAGGFAQRPRAWRFVVLRFAAGARLAFTPAQADAIARDHVECLWRLRTCAVRETVALDRRTGDGLGLAKLLVEVDRRPEQDASAARAAFDGIAARVREALADGFGARLLLVDHVEHEIATEPVSVEGQRPTGEAVPSTKVGYLECYVDHARWGRELLGPLARGGGLRHPDLDRVGLYVVDEQAALDLRPPSPFGDIRYTA